MSCDPRASKFLDFRRIPLRIGGTSNADDGLFDFDAAAEDDVGSVRREGGSRHAASVAGV